MKVCVVNVAVPRGARWRTIEPTPGGAYRNRNRRQESHLEIIKATINTTIDDKYVPVLRILRYLVYARTSYILLYLIRLVSGIVIH